MTNYRKLGKSDLEISPLTFGGNVFGWTLNEQESFRMLDAFVDSGFNFIDTANSYSTWVPGNEGGESETIIGKWLKQSGKRDKILIATKLGSEMPGGKKGLSAAYIKEAVEESLKRLGTDHIDLYQSHYDDPETPISETMSAFNELIKEGKVRYIGASNLSAERIEASNKFAIGHNLNPYISIQPQYNMHDREQFEKEYLPLVEKENLAVLNYYALASGFLSGKYRSEEDINKSQRGSSAIKYLDQRGHNILAALDKISKELQSTPAQVSIAWLLHKAYITAPIVSATNEQQWNELVQANELKLNEAQMKELDLSSDW